MDTNQLDTESTQRSRIWRSREARGVRDALNGCVERGVLRDFNAGKLRLGRMTFMAMSHCGRVCRMSLDVDAATLSFSGLFPGVGERSPLFRQLKNFLRPFTSDQAPAPLRVDPGKGEVRLLADSAGLTLVIGVRNGEFEHCAARMVCIAEEAVRIFVRAEHCDPDRPEMFAGSSGASPRASDGTQQSASAG